MKDIGDAVDFGAQVFSAVRSGWLSLAVQSCFRGAAALFAAETLEYPAKEFLWRKYLLPFCFPCMKTYWSVHLNVAFKHWLHQNEMLGILTCFEVYFPA